MKMSSNPVAEEDSRQTNWLLCTVLLLLICAFAFGLRLVWAPNWFQTQMTADSPEYFIIAKGLVNGFDLAQDTSGRRTPGYPVFLAVIFYLTGNKSLSPVALAQTLLGLATAGFAFAMTWHLYRNQWLATVTAAVVAFDPALFAWERYIMTETLSAFLLMLVVYLLVAVIQKPRLVLYLALGITLGWLGITRPVFMPIPLVMVFLLLIAHRFAAIVVQPRRQLVVMLLVAMALPVAWSFWNHTVHGSWSPAQGGFSATQHVGGFLESVHYESPVERTLQEIYLEHRAEQIESTGKHANTVFYALSEMQQETGLTASEVSSLLFGMSVDAVLENPAAYYDSARLGWSQFWEPSLRDIPPWMQVGPMIKIYVEGFGFYGIVFASTIIAFLTLVLYRRIRLSQAEFIMIVILLIIADVAVISSLLELAENSRLRIPIQPLISMWLVWTFVWLWARLHDETKDLAAARS